MRHKSTASKRTRILRISERPSVHASLLFRVAGLLAAATVGLLLAASPARANHIAGATYTGTAATGGTVDLDVNSDGTAVTRFQVTSVPTTCGTISATATGTFSIVDHAFSNGSPTAVGLRFSGSFPSVQNAQGTMSFRSVSPACTSADVNWNATAELLGYARPKAATPLRVPLVPAHLVCRAPNRTHGPPLDSPSCAPPVQLSHYLTVGTPDANGNPANSIGFARLAVIVGDPATPEDEADVRLSVSVTDVRNKHDLSDYTGELQASTSLRLTDKGTTAVPAGDATMTDVEYLFAVPCSATAAAVGSTCTVLTTADSLIPDVVKEGERAIWQLGQVSVLDGGEDGLADTAADNTPFMKQGVFVP